MTADLSLLEQWHTEYAMNPSTQVALLTVTHMLLLDGLPGDARLPLGGPNREAPLIITCCS